MKKLDQIASILSAISGLTYEGESDAACSRMLPIDAWKKVASFDSQPTGSVSVDAEPQQLSDWALSVLPPVLGSRVFLSLGGYGSLPWIQVAIDDSARGLADLWMAIEAHEMLVMNDTMDRIIGLTEEEYEYEAHQVMLS